MSIPDCSQIGIHIVMGTGTRVQDKFVYFTHCQVNNWVLAFYSLHKLKIFIMSMNISYKICSPVHHSN